MSIEAMKQALEALQGYRREMNDGQPCDAEKTLRAAIEDAEKQEPILYIHLSTLNMAAAHVGAWKPGHELPDYTPLYTTPPAAQPASRLVSHAELAQASKRYDTPYAAQRQPLTDEEIRELSSEVPLYDISASDLRQFARAIEQAHGIKERA